MPHRQPYYSRLRKMLSVIMISNTQGDQHCGVDVKRTLVEGCAHSLTHSRPRKAAQQARLPMAAFLKENPFVNDQWGHS
jgi:hypothetical protein